MLRANGRPLLVRWALALVVLLLLVEWCGAFWGPMLSFRRMGRPEVARNKPRRRSVVRRRLLRLASSPFRLLMKSPRAAPPPLSSPTGSKVDALKRARAIAQIVPSRSVKLPQRPVRSRPLQVITDIDDTVKSSGGVRLFGVALGGIDTQYRRGQFYPGAFRFALELARYGVPKDRQPPRVAVLTARAREFKFALELKPTHPICVRYSATGVESGVEGWGVGTVLYGSVKEWICQGRKGLRKFRNFEQLKRLDSSGITDYVFVGDTGELDLQAGESMARKYPDRMRALFMHFVSEAQPPPSLPADRKLAGVPIVYFRTYVGAAIQALRLGMLDLQGLASVVSSAVEDLGRCERATPEQWGDLLRDIEAAYNIVVKSGGGPAVPPEVSEFLRKVLAPLPATAPVKVRR